MRFEIDGYDAMKDALFKMREELQAAGVCEESIFDGTLIADELLVNALKHGNGKAFFCVERTEVTLILSVKSTPPFCPPATSTLTRTEAESGRGLFLVDRLAERRQYSESLGTSVTIRIKKND